MEQSVKEGAYMSLNLTRTLKEELERGKNKNSTNTNTTSNSSDDKKETTTTTTTTEDTQKSQNKSGKTPLSLTIEPDKPKNIRENNLNNTINTARNLDRRTEQGFVNEKNGASIVLRENGQINMSSSWYSHMKISPKTINEITMESGTVANRRRLTVDEIIINEHKLNPNLYELTNFKFCELQDGRVATVGNFCIEGSVLVRAWEPELKRYMMIRRPCRMPMFSTKLNVPEINPALGIEDPYKNNEKIQANLAGGYRVNDLITDAKSLIGKQGQDKAGINRKADGLGDSGSYSSSGSTTASSASAAPTGVANPTSVPDGYLSSGDTGLGQFDSKYVTKWESSPGATDLVNVRSEVVSKFNALAKKYSESVGGAIITITGGAEKGYHAAGEYGHEGGWKLDIDGAGLSNQQLFLQLCSKYGISVGDEGDHYDLAFHPNGGVGGTVLV